MQKAKRIHNVFFLLQQKRGKECADFGCSNTFYDSEGKATGIRFSKFPSLSWEINRWCNLIKKQNNEDSLSITSPLALPLLNYEEPMNKDVETQTDYSIKYLERKDSRMYFWQGIDKYENGTSKYQKENINKLGCKRKLTL